MSIARSVRAAADWRARNPALADRLAAVLPKRPRLVQFGADGGALLRWLAPRLARPLVWEFVDIDAEAVAATYEDCARAAAARGITVTWPGQALLLHVPGGAWRIEGSVGDIAAPATLDLSRVDALLCERLLPHATLAWLEELAEHWHGPLLATLNATDHPLLLPPAPRDRAIARLLAHARGALSPYENSGAALGGGAVPMLARLLRARGDAVRLAASDWQVRREMLLLRDWIEQAAEAGARAPRLRPAIATWRAQRLAQALTGRLQLRVPHQDLLSLPS